MNKYFNNNKKNNFKNINIFIISLFLFFINNFSLAKEININDRVRILSEDLIRVSDICKSILSTPRCKIKNINKIEDKIKTYRIGNKGIKGQTFIVNLDSRAEHYNEDLNDVNIEIDYLIRERKKINVKCGDMERLVYAPWKQDFVCWDEKENREKGKHYKFFKSNLGDKKNGSSTVKGLLKTIKVIKTNLGLISAQKICNTVLSEKRCVKDRIHKSKRDNNLYYSDSIKINIKNKKYIDGDKNNIYYLIKEKEKITKDQLNCEDSYRVVYAPGGKYFTCWSDKKQKESNRYNPFGLKKTELEKAKRECKKAFYSGIDGKSGRCGKIISTSDMDVFKIPYGNQIDIFIPSIEFSNILKQKENIIVPACLKNTKNTEYGITEEVCNSRFLVYNKNDDNFVFIDSKSEFYKYKWSWDGELIYYN